MADKCMICGEGEIVETEERDHVTQVFGIRMVLPVAIVGRCNKCGAINYAIRKDQAPPGDGQGNAEEENHHG